MTETERYLFDTQGCLIIENVLSRDEVQRLLDGIPRSAEGRIMTAEYPNTFRGLLEYQEPLYRDLINHTAIVPSLREILTSPDASPWSNKFYLSHEYGLVFQAGDRGPWFHGGGTPYEPWTGYTVRDGRIFCGLVAVIWVLTDVREGDGGFWYIPGSHKASFPLPRQIQTYEIVPRCVVQPAVEAGSAILFTESLTHGTRPWTAPHERIAPFYQNARKAPRFSAGDG